MANDKLHFNSQIERWAHSAWERLSLSAPCDLQAVSEFLKIRVEHRPMAKQLHGIFFKFPDSSMAIRVNSSLPLARQRFVWAHEIGHALLTHNRPGEFTVELRAGIDGPNERACDEFAVNLLMPETEVRQLAADLGHPHYVNKTRTLSEKFGVSQQAMRIRLQKLGLEYIPKAR